MDTISFKKATLADKDYIFQWLAKPHVQEFWDNSQEHRDDILNFLHGKKERPYAHGIFTYWIGFIDTNPYCLVMTSEVLASQTDISDLWRNNLSKTGKTFSIDFMIGNEKYLSKGLAAPTLEKFTEFISEHVDRSINMFIIDPAETNPRAKHVYEKAGFKTVAEFERDFGIIKNLKHFLMIKKLS